MLPRSGERVVEYRRWLRRREADLIVARLRRQFPRLAQLHGGTGPLLLEFGSGGGHQIPNLRKLGRVIGSDVYISEDLPGNELRDSFLICDISQAPFRDGVFDVVYSNHVLEHVRQLDQALDEIQRIGAPGCVFAFSVPTPLWLFLCIPAKYLDRLKRVFGKIGRLFRRAGPKSDKKKNIPDSLSAPPHPDKRRGVLDWLFPGGHGEYPNFWDAVRAFRGSAWRARFARHGFQLVEERKLLLYATARWPFIPANQFMARLGLASSRLFILQRAPERAAPNVRKNMADLERAEKEAEVIL